MGLWDCLNWFIYRRRKKERVCVLFRERRLWMIKREREREGIDNFNPMIGQTLTTRWSMWLGVWLPALCTEHFIHRKVQFFFFFFGLAKLIFWSNFVIFLILNLMKLIILNFLYYSYLKLLFKFSYKLILFKVKLIN